VAQGKAWNKAKVLASLEEYFKLGYSRYKACMLIGLDQSTLTRWEQADPTLSLKIDSWIEWPNTLARRNWVSKLADSDYTASKEWLERRDKGEFSPKQEVENTGEITVKKVIVDA